MRYPRNCWHLLCRKCRLLVPRKGGRFVLMRGRKEFICAACASRKEAA